MSETKLNPGDFIFFSLSGLLGFFLFLGTPPVLDGAEARIAEMAREMALMADYLRPQLYFEVQPWHPPLMLWLQALCIEVLGVGAWAVRLPSALLGLAAVLQLYQLCLHLKGRLFARLATVLFLGSALVLGGMRLGLPAAAGNLFLLLAIGQWLLYERLSPEKARKDAGPWAAGFWLGLASLSAGPWVLLLALAAYLLPRLAIPVAPPWTALLKSIAGWAILTLSWYGLQAVLLGPDFTGSLLLTLNGLTEGASLQRLVMGSLCLLAAFPLTPFLFRTRSGSDTEKLQKWMMIVWLLQALVLEMALPQLLPGIILLAALPAAFLSAQALTDLLKKQAPAPWEAYLFAGMSLLALGLIPSLLNLLVNNLELLVGALSDASLSARFRQDAGWSGWEWLVGAVFLIGLGYNLIQLREKRFVSFGYLQLLLGILLVTGTYAALLPGITRYTQGPVEDFFRERAGQDYYLLTEGYESALPWFYGQVKPIRDARAHDPEWLTEGEVNKDVLLVAPVSAVDAAFRARFRSFQKLYEEGGFAFFIRKKSTPNFGTLRPERL